MYATAVDTNHTVTARLGTTITGTTAHTKTAGYTTLIASTTSQIYGLFIRGTDVAQAALDTGILLDLATGAASSETIIAANLNFGEAAAGSGTHYFIPVSIASGARVSARIQSTILNDTIVVSIWCLRSPPTGFAFTYGTSIATFGAVTASSRGTLVAPGSGAFGATWIEIGTLASALDTWFVGYDTAGDTTVLTLGVIVKIGHGPNNASVTEIGDFHINQNVNEALTGGIFPTLPLYKAVANGDKVWCKIASGETENRGIIIYGGTTAAPFRNFYSGQT